jgi:hypothetical protein
MSKVLGYLIVIGLMPAMLPGQNVRVLQERVQREAELNKRAMADLAEHRSFQRRFRTASDTLVIAGGTLTILTHRNIAPIIRAAAAQTDSVLRAVDDLLPRVQGGVLYAELDTLSRRYGYNQDSKIRLHYMLPPGRAPALFDARPDVEEISRTIEGTMVHRMMDRGRTPLIKWHRSSPPLRAEDARREPSWETVRFDILESPSVLGPRCYRGDIAACSMQLGLTPVEDPVMAWYDSLTRVSTVRRTSDRTLRFDKAATTACLTGNDVACGRALHAIHTFENPPAGPASRDALIWQAVHMGGDGAVERLLTSTGSAAEALAAAAKAPTDSVIRMWQRSMRDGAVGSKDLTVKMTLVAIGWVLLLLLASTRITRWR